MYSDQNRYNTNRMKMMMTMMHATNMMMPIQRIHMKHGSGRKHITLILITHLKSCRGSSSRSSYRALRLLLRRLNNRSGGSLLLLLLLLLGHLTMLLEYLLLESSRASIERPELVATAAHTVLAHRLELHAHLQALLETAVGAAFALLFVDLTCLLVHARVELLVLHGALEEALARLACEKAVVKAAHFVAAHRT